jgi:putative ABC transport system permease protein
MLLNYIKITFAVMRRRKFFTFISMFGISFTLLALIVLTAFVEHLLGPNYPEWNRHELAYITQLDQSSSTKGSRSSGMMSFSYTQRYVKTLKTPRKIGISSFPLSVTAYANGKKIGLLHRYTDAEFWEVTQFDFLEGRPYTQQDIDQNARVAVITDRVRDQYFGKNSTATGQNIEVEHAAYRVIGVVRGAPIVRIHSAADIWYPYHLSKADLKDQDYRGMYMAILLGDNEKSLEKMQAEYKETMTKIKPYDPDMDIVSSQVYNFGQTAANMLLSDTQNGLMRAFILLSVFALLFMLIPALNLININISRILERASEIGLRRACGASAKHLIVQFTIENVFIAVIGGVVALVLAAVFIRLFNQSDIYPYADLRINWRVAGIAFVLSVIFGLMSGVYPAWRMSKLAPADALKSQ